MLWQKGEESPGNAELCVGVPHIPGARGMFLLGLPTNEIRKYFFYLACVVFYMIEDSMTFLACE